MPVIIVYGAAFRGMECSPSRIPELKIALQRAVLCVESLGISSERSVSVFCPVDGEYQHEVRELVIEVCGLFVDSRRGDTVRAELAAQLGYAALAIYPGIFVECFITPFDLRQGFWASTNSVSREEVLLLCEKLPLLISLAHQSAGNCYCESDARHLRSILGVYQGFLREAKRVAALERMEDFRVQADVLATQCCRESLLKEVCTLIGWCEPKP